MENAALRMLGDEGVEAGAFAGIAQVGGADGEGQRPARSCQPRLFGRSHLIGPAPFMVPEQLQELGPHHREIGVMAEPRLERRVRNARLVGIDLPGMEIEDGRPAARRG